MPYQWRMWYPEHRGNCEWSVRTMHKTRDISQDHLVSIPVASRNEMVLIQICVHYCASSFLRCQTLQPLGRLKCWDSVQILRPLSQHFLPYSMKICFWKIVNCVISAKTIDDSFDCWFLWRLDIGKSIPKILLHDCVWTRWKIMFNNERTMFSREHHSKYVYTEPVNNNTDCASRSHNAFRVDGYDAVHPSVTPLRAKYIRFFLKIGASIDGEKIACVVIQFSVATVVTTVVAS